MKPRIANRQPEMGQANLRGRGIRRRRPLALGFVVAALSVLPIAGCSILSSEQRDPVTIYAPNIRIAPDPSWPSVSWSLVVAPPNAARIVDSPRISVRPTPSEVQVYRGASWAQPATELVEDAVLRALEDSGRIAAVARQTTGIRADYKLALDIRRFEADYAGQSTPSAVVEIDAKLLNVSDQRVIAARTFLETRPATGAEIPLVVDAFEQSLNRITGEIAGWTLRQNGSP